MREDKALLFKNREEWRGWLDKNHDKKKEVWLIYYKKHTGKPSVPYEQAVEEALCFGWIDGKVRSLDAERFMQKYTPRSEDSVWSLLNKKRALKMIKGGWMTRAGMKKIQAAKKTGKWQAAYSSRTKPKAPPDLKKALEKNTKALKNFNSFSNSQQLMYIYWVLSAKKEKTRQKRIKQIVDWSEQNKKI